MSRMDRYKNIHEESDQGETEDRIVRKKQKLPKNTNKKAKKKRLFFNKQKKTSKKSWLKRIMLGILLLFILSIVFFFKGKSFAENDASLPKEEIEEFNGVKSSNGANNILILGSDARGDEAGQADTIMVLQLDGPSKKPKLISFMRDTFVEIPGYDANKINATYPLGGAELVRKTLSESYNLECKYYAKVDFQSFEKIIDAMFPKGVKIDAEKDLDLDGVDIAKGVQKMDGHTLLQYSRFRMDEEGDFGRVRRQQQVMEAVMGQLKKPLALLRTPESLGRFVGYVSTNIPINFMFMNGFSLLKGSGNMDRLTVPVDGSWDYADSSYAGSILATDDEMNSQAIANFLNK